MIWCATENRAIAGPAPLPAATAKASRAPTPPIHMLAARMPALTIRCFKTGTHASHIRPIFGQYYGDP